MTLRSRLSMWPGSDKTEELLAAARNGDDEAVNRLMVKGVVRSQFCPSNHTLRSCPSAPATKARLPSGAAATV